jgi:hypothetical protein
MAHLDHRSRNALGTTAAARTPNQKYHLYLADTYTDQLQHHYSEVTEVDHDMLPGLDSPMTGAGSNTTDLDMALKDKTELTLTAQQDLHLETSNDGMQPQWDIPYHDPSVEHPLDTHDTTVKKRSINFQSCMNNHMVSGKELPSVSQDCRALAVVYLASDQAKATH